MYKGLILAQAVLAQAIRLQSGLMGLACGRDATRRLSPFGLNFCLCHIVTCAIFPHIMAASPDALTYKGLSSDIGIGIATTFLYIYIYIYIYVYIYPPTRRRVGFQIRFGSIRKAK